MMPKEKKINKSLMFAIAGVALLILAVSGSAYAFFSASATANNNISGETLSINLGIDLELVSVGIGSLIPIYDGSVSGHNSQLQSAVDSAKGSCIDNNEYTVCKIYKITISNSGISDTTVNTKVEFDTDSTNLKWANMINQNTVGTTHLYTDNMIAQNIQIKGSSSNNILYIMVYVNNTGTAQNDGGTSFEGVVTVTTSTGEIIQAEF